jgi:hypothetical protein
MASPNTKEQLVYAEFDQYDFNNDPTFQAGVTHTQQPANIDAKHFYFSRFFTPFSLAEYQHWKSENNLKADENNVQPTLSFKVFI